MRSLTSQLDRCPRRRLVAARATGRDPRAYRQRCAHRVACDDDAVWATASANISSFAGQAVRIRIEAADASTASLVEAAVDDVVITQQ